MEETAMRLMRAEIGKILAAHRKMFTLETVAKLVAYPGVRLEALEAELAEREEEFARISVGREPYELTHERCRIKALKAAIAAIETMLA